MFDTDFGELYGLGDVSTDSQPPPETERAPRVVSIDALRGLVMFTMIFVNDLAGVSPTTVPPWMRHFHGRSGMTFVDLVFPAFLFIVGMSIPFALGGRLRHGEPLYKSLGHVLVRTLALLAIGILMVNDESPGQSMAGLPPNLWAVLMFLSAIFAFSSVTLSTASSKQSQIVTVLLRGIGMLGMLVLAFMFRGEHGERIITLSPFAIHTVWYGILGLIGWAYLAGSIVFLLFRCNSTALLGCVALLMALYPAERTGVFDKFWLNRYVGIGGTLGSQASITVAGILLSSILIPSGKLKFLARVRFAMLFILGCAAAALLLAGLYGINKNAATPSWCFWSCAITASIWLVFHALSDLGPVHPVSRILAVAGQNVLLAYLISEMLPSALDLLHLDNFYSGLAEHGLASAVARSAACGAIILCVTAVLNRAGFRLKL
jgi:heparan-alpha-glucosaminide N-acetyltransferase